MIILAARLKMACRGVRLEIKPVQESRKQEVTNPSQGRARDGDEGMQSRWSCGNKRQGDLPGGSGYRCMKRPIVFLA